MIDEIILREEVSLQQSAPIRKKSGLFLTEEEEQDLAKRIEKGDEQARLCLFESNLRLVPSIIRRYHCPQLDADDLIQEGRIGLWEASRTYNHRSGYRFTTYATWIIRRHLWEARAHRGYQVRLSTQDLTAFDRLRRVELQCPPDFHIQDTDGPAETALSGISADLLWLFQSQLLAPLSIEQPAEDDMTLGDLLFAPPLTTENESKSLHICAMLEEALKKLTSRQRQIVNLCFGLGEEPSYTIDEISRMLKVTRESIRVTRERALHTLRTYYASPISPQAFSL